VNGVPVAAYKVGLYPAFPSADYARTAVRLNAGWSWQWRGIVSMTWYAGA